MGRYFDSMGVAGTIPQLETELDRFARQLSSALNPLDAPITVQTDSSELQYQNILKDYGQGRISSGLRSLELLSHLRNGVSPQDLFLFDDTIFYGTAQSFSSTNNEELVRIVLANLGMLEVYQGTPEMQRESYRSLCLRVVNKVKAGAFLASEFSAVVRRESKILVNAYLTSRGVI